MSKVKAAPLPSDSLLAQHAGPEDYTDCFVRTVPGAVSLSEYITRFYSSWAFLPERKILGLISGNTSREHIAALAEGRSDTFGVWKVLGRRENQILLDSKSTGTASWLALEPMPDGGTKLYFGSWVGSVVNSGWKSMLLPHVWYSRLLLGGV